MEYDQIIVTLDYECDSKILLQTKNENKFLEIIKNWCGYNKLELLYRGTRDGTSSKIFHDKCDNQGPTITLYRNDKGYIFGGYSSISWENKGDYKKDKNCFIFTLYNIHNTEPCKFPIKSENEGVFHRIDRGPTFGSCCDITIIEDFKKDDFRTDFPCRYKDILVKGKSIFTGDYNNDNNKIKIDEIEVFKLM